jgi:hypothetical protein
MFPVGSLAEILIPIGPLANRLRSSRATYVVVDKPLIYVHVYVLQREQNIVNTSICFAQIAADRKWQQAK